MARRRFRNTNLTRVVSAVLAVAFLVGAVIGVTALFGRDSKKVSPSKFSVGAVNANGLYVKSNTSIYTKEFIECQGLTIEPDFEASGTFQVFYYDPDKVFIGATEVMNASEGVYSKLDTFTFAKYCRIMITPDLSSDTDSKRDEKITFLKVRGYANDYTVTVDRKQDFAYSNSEFKNTTRVTGYMWSFPEGATAIQRVQTDATSVIYNAFSVESADGLCVLIDESTATSGNMVFYFVDSNGQLVGEMVNVQLDSAVTIDGKLCYDDISVPDGAESCYVTSVASITSMRIFLK